MVRLITSCTVIPAEPTPHVLLPLSIADQLHSWPLSPTIFVYRKSCPLAFETLRKSLSSVLVPFYPLAGRLEITDNGLYQLICNEKGIELLEAESERTLQDYGDFGPADNIEELLPWPDVRPIQELPLLKVQFTRLACGGHTLGVALSHILMDGYSLFLFLKSWAKLARGEKLDMIPFHDRTVLKRSYLLSSPSFNHEVLEPQPLLIGTSDSRAERMKETVLDKLRLTKEQVGQLVRIANQDDDRAKRHSRPYTSFEAVTAHIWRCVLKARKCSPDQPLKLRFPIDFRSRINPPLPAGYFGNSLVPGCTPVCYYKDILSRPLGYAAGKIREGKNMYTDQYIKSLLTTLASREQQITKLRLPAYKVGSQQGIFLGNPNMGVTSWVELGMEKIDFGWGSPDFCGPTILHSDGKCYILPGKDKSIWVSIRLQRAHMDAFRTSFYNDISAHLSSSKL